MRYYVQWNLLVAVVFSLGFAIPSFAAERAEPAGGLSPVLTIKTDNGAKLVLDTTGAQELTEWAHKELAPVVKEWYPKVVKLLPSKDYQAPREVNIYISKSVRGVAYTTGTDVYCAAEWFSKNLKGEARGAVVHELVHVVQQYGLARRNGRRGSRPPGWLTEGIADYVRWYLYEPESRGAELGRRQLAHARYDASYRVSANFLNWVVSNHDKQIVEKLNAALREGRYNEDTWKQSTGKTVRELATLWKAELEDRLSKPRKSGKNDS